MIKKYSILDIFTKISDEHEAVKPDLCIRLWNHLKKNCEKSIDEVRVGSTKLPGNFLLGCNLKLMNFTGWKRDGIFQRSNVYVKKISSGTRLH